MEYEHASLATVADDLPAESGHFHTAMGQRLDSTTNWAVVLALGITTFALGSDRNPPYILLLGLAAVGMCLVIEARRYQHLHQSLCRLRMLERYYFAGLLVPGTDDGMGWRERLAGALRRPTQTIGLVAAARFRLRRNYAMLFYFITAAWLTKVFIHPGSPGSPGEFYDRLAVGDLFPSWFVVVTAGAFVIVASVLAISSASEDEIECRPFENGRGASARGGPAA
jgi:uncharacterized membrane protein